MIQFGMVGAGWRSSFYLRCARACPDRFRVMAVVSRDPASKAKLASEYGIEIVGSIDEMLAKGKPNFVVSSVPWKANPDAVRELVGRGLPVLSETPPATTVEEMADLYSLVKAGAKIQVAEQYHLQPLHAARIAFARSGKMGRVTQAQLSVCHGYHGISLLRRLLGVSFEDATIRARTWTSPIMKSPDRNGPPEKEEIVQTQQEFAWLDFGDRLGVFDFIEDQYFSYIRGQRVCVRGERGEIIDDCTRYLIDPKTVIEVPFVRHDAGALGNFDGHYHKGYTVGEQWSYRNPLAPCELTDDEIAVGDCMIRMANYARGGPDFYSLAEACQDRYLDIKMKEAEASGREVRTEKQSWSFDSLNI
jgi:predicted dehydrogenase